MPKKKPTIIKDKYFDNRGGYAQILSITCSRCEQFLCSYQKDGPGDLLRMYLDRISNGDHMLNAHWVICKCPKCNKLIGLYYLYEKEQRPALKLFAGAIQQTEV